VQASNAGASIIPTWDEGEVWTEEYTVQRFSISFDSIDQKSLQYKV